MVFTANETKNVPPNGRIQGRGGGVEDKLFIFGRLTSFPPLFHLDFSVWLIFCQNCKDKINNSKHTYSLCLEKNLDHLIVTLYTLSIYPSVLNQLIRTLFNAQLYIYSHYIYIYVFF